MNQLFHYHITAYLARLAGFSTQEAIIIATSSTMVDYAVLPLPLKISSDETYILPCTHHYGFGGKGASAEVWVPFHFLPDGSDAWKVSPKNPVAKEVLVAALKSGNLYRIGIALHSYADTWAHQGFSGLKDDSNEVDSSSPLPAIGHAQASRVPDIAGLAWIDPRKPGEIQWNGKRFLEAAEYIYRYLSTYQGRPFSDWEVRKHPLESLLEPIFDWDIAPAYHDQVGQVHDGLRTLGNKMRGFIDQIGGFDGEKNQSKNHMRLEVRLAGLADRDLVHQLRALSGLNDFDENLWLDEVVAEGSSKIQERLRSGIGARVLSLGQAAFRKNPELFPFKVETRGNFTESQLYRWSEAANAHRKTAWEVLANYGLKPDDLARSIEV